MVYDNASKLNTFNELKGKCYLQNSIFAGFLHNNSRSNKAHVTRSLHSSLIIYTMGRKAFGLK